ncbi:MAG: CIA30 family protein [Candidatus Aminicenantes bacterium]|nr:CIA30 family protein [Candidatus Aminicenantes bacterium]
MIKQASICMRQGKFHLLKCVLPVCLALGFSAVSPVEMQPNKGKPACFVIRDVRVFDGNNVIEKTNVLVREGRIEKVALALRIPDSARIIEGQGKTLLPGLIDSHTHIFAAGLQQSVQFGVTTDIDMFTQVDLVQAMKKQQAAGANPGRADLISSGTLATVPGGHGTEYGLVIPTLSKPEEALAFVDARIGEGSDFIKIIYGHGWNFPSLDKRTMAALVQAAHRRNKLTAVHIDTLQDAFDAVECGADILAHVWIDREMTDKLLTLVQKKRTVLIPTLTVISSICGLKPGITLLRDPQLEPLMDSDVLLGLQREFPISAFTQENFATAQMITRLFKENHLPVLAGTDAPNPGTAYGASLHQELEMLVQCGFSPAEALNAATALPAEVFALSDRGRIAQGLRADLLLVEGNPLAAITDTRRIAGIWKEGVELDRSGFREKIAREKKSAAGQPTPMPPAGLGTGLVSDFDDGSRNSRFGSGWLDSTDAIMGGKSTVEIKITSAGAENSLYCLTISGEVLAGAAFAWSGTILFPAEKPFAAADLSGKKSISFWARGDGQTYQVLFYSRKTGFIPLSQSFTCSAEWQQFNFAFSSFPNLDSTQVTAIAFIAGPQPGPFRLQLDHIALQ